MSNHVPVESVVDPELPIVDAHHHLWFLPEAALAAMEGDESMVVRALAPTFRRRARYLFDELMFDFRAGHNIRASIFVETHAMYRINGSNELRSVGEIEFANGMAAMAASGTFGDTRACAGIVGAVDLRLGKAVEHVLAAHIQAGGGRYRGVRYNLMYDEDSSILGAGVGIQTLLSDPQFRSGFQQLQPMGLSFDALVLEPQLSDLLELARMFPETPIILNHVGVPIGVGRYAGKREDRFPLWRDNIRALSRCENVSVKLGGLGMPLGGFTVNGVRPPATSAQLAAEWKPYIETCIDAFGALRCMFESNFPVDSGVCSYLVLWNAFKRIAAGASADEKAALFGGTARRIYRLDI